MTSLESTESSSPIVTRAVASGLVNRYCDNYVFPAWQKLILAGLGVFPQRFARAIISRFQSISGLSPASLDNFSIKSLIQERLNDYANTTGSFPAIVVGAALGGATTYLSLAVGGPFLPQAFVITLKGGSKSGNIDEYLHRSLNIALRIAEENPDLLTIQHYDPVHDGWLTRYVNHLRFKLLDLPTEYAEFIKAKLSPGGAVVFLDCSASWLRYRLGPRSFFQVGGWGGIPPEEFLDGSDRLLAFAHQAGLQNVGWKLKEFTPESGPESEWGIEPGLGKALEAFCKAEAYRFIRIPLPHPNHFSRLAFSAAQKIMKNEGEPPAGVIVEMFSQFDENAARRGGLLPLWLVFNTRDSLNFLQEMTSEFPQDKPVFFSPLSTFSLTPDLVPYEEWGGALKKFQWVNIGTRADHYPSDPLALVKWTEPLRKWVEENPRPIHSVLEAEELAEISKQNIK
jgi:hypothetical protein